MAGDARWSSALAEPYRTIWRDYRTGVVRLFSRAAQDRGIVLDPDRTALTFSQPVEGLWVGWAADPQAIAPEKAAACCHAYVDMVLVDKI